MVAMDSLRLDLLFAFRTLRRNALFTLSVTATLAIGIGAATAVFGVVNGVLLEPLPIRDQRRVVVLRKEQLVGIAVGIAISAAATRLLGAVLYGVTPTDPLTIAIASGTLLAVAALGCWIPARAATLVDPLIALKTE